MNPADSIDIERGPLPLEQKEEKPCARREDVELFGRFLSGDDAALVRLFDLHNDRLFRYCRQMLGGDMARAQDVAQEVWERVIRIGSAGRASADNPLGLLVTIARNLCLDQLRSQRDHLRLDEIARPFLLPESPHEPTELEEIVALALAHIPIDQREVLTLHYYSGYPLTEVAAMLGESTGAIKNRAWRGRVHLARLVKALVGMEEDGESSADTTEAQS
jgi:RNA polymerase sigma-70 factor, ECF subfamily